MAELTLGQRVRYTATLTRTDDPVARRRRVWRPDPTWGHPDGREGIVVGLRTLANGISDWDPDGGYEWVPQETFPAVLVAFHVRRKPVLCPVDAVTPAADPAPEPPAEPDGPHLLTLLEEGPDAV